MIKERNIVVCIILTIVTCGIYGIYWMIALQNDSLKAAKEEGTSGGMVLLLTLVTCGIYGIYWAYTLGNRVDKIKGSNGNSGLIFLLLSLFGLGIVNYCIAQSAVNTKANG